MTTIFSKPIKFNTRKDIDENKIHQTETDSDCSSNNNCLSIKSETKNKERDCENENRRKMTINLEDLPFSKIFKKIKAKTKNTRSSLENLKNYFYSTIMIIKESCTFKKSENKRNLPKETEKWNETHKSEYKCQAFELSDRKIKEKDSNINKSASSFLPNCIESSKKTDKNIFQPLDLHKHEHTVKSSIKSDLKHGEKILETPEKLEKASISKDKILTGNSNTKNILFRDKDKIVRRIKNEKLYMSDKLDYEKIKRKAEKQKLDIHNYITRKIYITKGNICDYLGKISRTDTYAILAIKYTPDNSQIIYHQRIEEVSSIEYFAKIREIRINFKGCRVYEYFDDDD